MTSRSPFGELSKGGSGHPTSGWVALWRPHCFLAKARSGDCYPLYFVRGLLVAPLAIPP